jgi:hypothetical protein
VRQRLTTAAQPLGSGIYLLRFSSGKEQQVLKLVLMK